MKKLLVLFLCLATVFSVTGCSSKTNDDQTVEPTNEVSNVIDLGGNLGTYTLEGETYGLYKVVETPEKLIYENTKTTLYEDLDSDTPYIAVYRYAKDGKTLEEEVQAEADLYSQGYYQLFKAVDNLDSYYFCFPSELNGNYYYVATQIVEDGDDFVEVSYFGKTEELQIGDTNVYAYVPVGYTSHIDDDYKAHGTIFCGNYSDDYYFPTIFVGKWEFTYDYLEWYFGEDFPEGLPFSEEEHEKLVERIKNGEDVMHEFYELLGDTVVFDSYEAKESFDYNAGYYVLEGGKSEGTEAWFEIDGDWYVAWFESDLTPKPAYTSTFLASLHTK